MTIIATAIWPLPSPGSRAVPPDSRARWRVDMPHTLQVVQPWLTRVVRASRNAARRRPARQPLAVAPAVPVGAGPRGPPARRRAGPGLRPDLRHGLGPGPRACARTSWVSATALPRAVPSDAVVAVLDEVVAGQLLQKVVLLGTPGRRGGRAAAPGARPVARRPGWWPSPLMRVEPVRRRAARCIGHWPLLVGYAVLPWLVVTRRDVGTRPDRACPLGVPGAAPARQPERQRRLGDGGRRARRRGSGAVARRGTSCSCWVAGRQRALAGRRAAARPRRHVSDPAGATVFATRRRGARCPARWQPCPSVASGTPRWCPASRPGLLGVVLTLLLRARLARAGAVRVAPGCAGRRALGRWWSAGCVGLGAGGR